VPGARVLGQSRKEVLAPLSVFWPLVLAAIVAAMQLSFLYVLLGLYILLLAVRSLMLALPVRGRGLSVAKLRSRPVAC